MVNSRETRKNGSSRLKKTMSTKSNEVEIDGDGNIVIQDGNNSNYNFYNSPPTADKKPKPLPKIISTQSIMPPPYFTGRIEVLEGIRKALETYRDASLCGISGLGKSSVAFKYAEEAKGLYQHIVFIRIDRAGFETNINKTFELLGIELIDQEDEANKAARFRTKIEEICGNLVDEKFLLLIFDNADEVARLPKFLPNHDRLHILLTSNFEAIEDLGHKVDIGNLSEDEAMKLLYRIKTSNQTTNYEQLTDDEQNAARGIVRLFGFHALATYIAGNYIRTNKYTFAKYLARLQNAQGKILTDEKGVDAYQFKDIYSAFNIAFKEICNSEDKSKFELTQISIAWVYMNIASVLAADKMPEEIFWETAGDLNPDWQDFLTADEDNRNAIYQRLAQYKLFERNEADDTLTIHRLVRLFLADKLKNERQTIEKSLAKTLSKHFQHYDFTNKTEVERFLPHVGSFLEYLEEFFSLNQRTNNQNEVSNSKNQLNLSLANESTALLCNHYARFHQQVGQYEIAKKYYECFKSICEGIKDIDQRLLATSYNNLAVLYRIQGRYAEAELLCNEALLIRKKVLGKNHIDTAWSNNNLAMIYKMLGRYKEAEFLFRKTLMVCEQKFGKINQHTAQIYDNLASVLESQKKYAQAKPLYKQAIEINEKVLGENDPRTAITYNDLALLYRKLNKLWESEKYFLKAKRIFEEHFGINHYWTAVCYDNLAAVYELQDKYAEAESLYSQALLIMIKILGENHQYTARSYLNLGGFHYKRGNSEYGLELCEKALKIYRKALPASHPTIQSCENSIEIIKNSMEK